MRPRAVPAILAVILLAGGCFGKQYRENPRVDVADGDPIVQMKSASSFPNLFQPPMVPADRQSDPPTPLERVVGIPLGTASRAYPLGLMDRYEVINDGVLALPYVVARCGLAGVVAIYDRRVAGRELEFENSGAIWRDTLVMRDRQTGTYWSAATGRALSGALAGVTLERVPAIFTFAADWARAHPDSLYADIGKSTSVPLTMRIYGVSPMQGVSGKKTEDARYEPKQEVETISDGDEAIAFTKREIEKAGSVSVLLAGRPIRIEWDAGLQTPRAYVADAAAGELAVVPLYWFAVTRHFRVVRTIEQARR